MRKILLLTIVATITFGCATTDTTIIPNADGSYTMNATDRTEAAALDGGINAATKACQGQGKTLAVLSHKTKYNGGMLDHSTKEAINNIAFMNAKKNQAPMNVMDTSQDYTVNIKYQCK